MFAGRQGVLDISITLVIKPASVDKVDPSLLSDHSFILASYELVSGVDTSNPSSLVSVKRRV